MMKVEIINEWYELEKTVPFRVRHLLWGTKQIPETYGYLGYKEQEGLFLKMICEEKDPLRACRNDQEPVYRDSAMEAFFMFFPKGNGRADGRDGVYINLEMNANGALLAEYGKGRSGRVPFPQSVMEKFACKADVGKDRWSVCIVIPESVLEFVYGEIPLGKGSSFCCNFYKISENTQIEHYASYAEIDTEHPDFHRPEFFAHAKITGE